MSFALHRMNTRVFFGAVLADFLFFGMFWFAPKDLMDSMPFQVLYGILIEVTLASALLIRYGPQIMKSRFGNRGWRFYFGVQAGFYGFAWGVGCSYMVLQLGLIPYSISVTTSVFAVAAIAVSTFAFDLLVCYAFLATLLGPLLYSSLFQIPDGTGVAGACLLCVSFFIHLAASLHRSDISGFLKEQTIRRQSLALRETNATLLLSNSLVQNMLDSIQEIFLLLDLDGYCFESPTERASLVLHLDPKGLPFTDILRLTESEQRSAQQWMHSLTSGRVDFEKLAGLGPNTWFDVDKQLTYRVRYLPLLNGTELSAVVMSLTDITSKLRAERQAEDAEARARFIMAVVENRSAFAEFTKRVFSLLLDLESWSNIDINALRRDLHTLKGSAAFFNLTALHQELNELELIFRSNADPTKHESLASPFASQMMAHFQTWFEKERVVMQRLRVFAPGDISFSVEHARAVREDYESEPSETRLFDSILLKLKSVNLETELAKYEWHIEKIAGQLGKKVRLEFLPANHRVRLLTEHYRPVIDTMIHLFNNAIDHGVETIKARREDGKPEIATLRIHCSRRSDQIVITVTDDGHGIDDERLRSNLLQKGYDVATLPAEEILQRIFDLGVTTKVQATVLSGQGVGLHALKEAVVTSGGRIRVSSIPRKGTRFEIQLPAPPDLVWFERVFGDGVDEDGAKKSAA